jgi:outer membrane protein assembly factor BamB
VAPPGPHADLDRDGTPDLLVFRPGEPDHWDEAPLRLYSGRGGHRLWKANGIRGTLRLNNVVSECFRVECREGQRRGDPTVLVAYGVGTFDRKGSGSGAPNEGWLALLSGSTGKLLWKEKLGGFDLDQGGGSDTRFQFPPFLGLQPPGFADINGDGVPDLVICGQRLPEKSDAGPEQELRALDGRNGRTLWRYRLPTETDFAFTTGPLAKDGSDKVLVASSDALHCLDCKSGQPEWTWTVPEPLHYLHFQGSSRPATPVLVDLDRNGRRSVCLLVQDSQSRQVLVLDWPDRVRHRLDIRPVAAPRSDESLAPEKGGFRLWSYELRGDGREALLYVSDGKVQARGGKLDKPLWEWPLPKGVGTILAVESASADNAAVVVVRSENTACGLDGETGQLRWRCEGTGNPAAVVSDPGSTSLPNVLFHVSKPEYTICRQASPVLATGRYDQPVLTPIEYPASAEDLWRTVPLPWEGQSRKRAAHALLPALACFGLLLYFAWKRRWRVALGLLVAAIAVPLVTARSELASWENRIAAEQHHAWGGWYWLWIYTLSAADEVPLCIYLWLVILAALFFVPRARLPSPTCFSLRCRSLS